MSPSSSWKGITRLRFPVDRLLLTQSNSSGNISRRRRCRRCSTVAGSSSSSAIARLCITSATALMGSVSASTCPIRRRSASASSAVTARSIADLSFTSCVSSSRPSLPVTSQLARSAVPLPEALPVPKTPGSDTVASSVLARLCASPSDDGCAFVDDGCVTRGRETAARAGSGTCAGSSRSKPSCHSSATPLELTSGVNASPPPSGSRRRNSA
mmetsp:Transcript_7582/g.30742  ORF Transcript_7582/g.30742 Transcript_7582/m.30742 type:complete len:213 (+) Transcript_7582:299-937(+)